MGFFSNLFKKNKFNLEEKKAELRSKINAIKDKYNKRDVNESLDRLLAKVSTMSSQDEYNSLSIQIEQLERDLDGMSSTKASRVVNRRVDEMTGRGKTITKEQRIQEDNESIIEENQNEIENVSENLKDAEAAVRRLQRKVDTATNKSDAIRFKTELVAAKEKKRNLERKLNYLAGSSSQRANVNSQIYAAELTRQTADEQMEIDNSMQNIDMSEMQAIGELRRDVIARQKQQSKELDQIAGFDDIPDFFEDDENERADEAMFELNRSLGGKSIDETLSELGSKED